MKYIPTHTSPSPPFPLMYTPNISLQILDSKQYTISLKILESDSPSLLLLISKQELSVQN